MTRRQYINNSFTSPFPAPVHIPNEFNVSSGHIWAPDNSKFIAKGANIGGHDFFWTGSAKNRSQAALNWGWNCVRINSQLADGDVYATPSYTQDGTATTANSYVPTQPFFDLVDEYLAAGLVVMLSLIVSGPGSIPNAQQTTDAATYWTAMANRYAGNPYVWFNPTNEPGSLDPVDVGWFTFHQAIIDAIRGTGATNIIVVDGTQWGQENKVYSTGLVPERQSAILTYGPRLVDSANRIVFSIHTYETFGYGTATQNDTKILDLITRIRAVGMTPIIGEAGSTSAATQTTANIPGQRRLACEATYRVSTAQEVGILAWHGVPGDGFALTTPGAFWSYDSPTSPTNLTWHGQLMWEFAH